MLCLPKEVVCPFGSRGPCLALACLVFVMEGSCLLVVFHLHKTTGLSNFDDERASLLLLQLVIVIVFLRLSNIDVHAMYIRART